MNANSNRINEKIVYLHDIIINIYDDALIVLLVIISNYLIQSFIIGYLI